MTEIQAAIEESAVMIAKQSQEIALLKGAISAQDEREQKAGERCGVPYEQYGCDWPDWMAEKVLWQAARIAQLEVLGPLIRVYGDTCNTYGQAIQSCGSSEQQDYRQTRDAALEQIDAILKGGA